MKCMNLLSCIRFALVYCFCLNTYAGQLSIHHPSLGDKTIIYEEKQGYAVVEGDILLGKLRDIKRPSAGAITHLGGYRWANNTIAFQLDEELPILNKISVLEAIVYWQSKTNLHFVELTSKNRELYPDAILFSAAEGTTCSSFVGRQGGIQVIYLAPRCTKMNTVHEIGHALGLWHEQSRMDRDQYVRIDWDNIEEPHQHNFDQYISDGEDIGEYDYESIMHYGDFAFSKNGSPTIIPLVAGAKIGQRERLSDKDLAAIATMYPLL